MSQYSKNIHNLSGMPEGFDAKVLAQDIEKNERPILHIARDDKRLDALRRALQFFAPQVPVFVFPAWDCLPYDRVSPNSDVSAARMATLATLASGFDKPFIILTTLNAATQFVPKREVLSDSSFVAEVGRTVNDQELRAYFTRMGFVQTPTVTEPGDDAIRGGIIDVYPPGEAGPVRMDMFGDELESARRFDPISQRTVEKLAKVEFAPVSEVVLDEDAIARFRNKYRTEFGAAGIDDHYTRRSAQGANTKVWNIGLHTFTKVWKPCSIICPMQKSTKMKTLPTPMTPVGTASKINMVRG